jgi:truncated hemoglobin YjbI
LAAMRILSDIETPQGVKKRVGAFYAKMNRDPLLAPVFNEIANVD